MNLPDGVVTGSPFSHWARWAVRALYLVSSAYAFAAPQAAISQTSAAPSPADVCLLANRGMSLDAPLPRTAARLRNGGTLKVVAIGSSSTVGLWVLKSAATYPAVLQRELAALRPTLKIEMINSGKIGDTIPGSISRFSRDVFAHKPDLVIWQLGTNDIAWGGSVDGLKSVVVAGVQALKSSGADVILMDQQYSPQVLASSHHAAMQRLIADISQQEHVSRFSRFELMRRSVGAGLPVQALVSWDGLHNSADGYECVGRALARAISAIAL
jgi:acyl-CoA thioesterase-1